VIFTFLFEAERVIEKKYGDAQQPKSTDQAQQSETPLFDLNAKLKVQDTHECPKGGQYPEDDVDEHIRRLLDWLLPRLKRVRIAEWILIVIGIIAAGIYYGQLSAFRRATTTSAQTEITLKMALVVPAGSYLYWNNTAKEGEPSIWVIQKFKNFGETRALRGDALWGWGHELPNAKTVFQGEYKGVFTGFWLPGELKDADRIKVPLRDIKERAEFKRPLYVYTRIRYDDVFPDRDFAPYKDHLIESCTQIVNIDTGEQDTPIGENTSWGGIPCTVGEFCLDNDCPDYKHKK
jgi:hypothetical protein